jgi:hypothetical protein
MRPLRLVLPAVAAVFFAVPAHAATITINYVVDLGLTPGFSNYIGPPLGTPSTSVTIAGVKATGLVGTLSGTTGASPNIAPVFSGAVEANLWGRNSPGDHGLGVCSEGTAPGGCGAGGDINEISNQLNQELLSLSLPAGFKWVSLTLSSLDANGQTNDQLKEQGWLLSDVDANPAGATNQFNFTGQEPGIEPTFSLASVQFQPFLFLVPFQHNQGTQTKHNNDFLLWQVVITNEGVGDGAPGDVPEPASLTLLGLGLSTAGVLRRKWRKR